MLPLHETNLVKEASMFDVYPQLFVYSVESLFPRNVECITPGSIDCSLTECNINNLVRKLVTSNGELD